MWKILQRPRLIGAAVVALIGFGIWMGAKLDGLGLGAGGGTGVGIGKSPTKVVDSHSDDGKSAGNVRPSVREKALDVVIDGDGYALRQRVDGREEFVPLSLSQVVDLAKEAPGDAEGIRVRVFRRGSALPTAEKALAAALRDANIADSAVITAEGLLD